MSRTERQRAGDAAESLVATRLAAAGWHVLGRQVRVGRREVDIVAVDPGPPAGLVVLEVRWRAGRGFGVAEETFDRRKSSRVRMAALEMVAAGRLPGGRPLPRLPLRIDLVVVEPGGQAGEPPVVRHHRAVGG